MTRSRAAIAVLALALVGCAAAPPPPALRATAPAPGGGDGSAPGAAVRSPPPGSGGGRDAAGGPGGGDATAPDFAVPDRDERTGSHRVLVARRFATMAEGELIDAAERLCPDQVEVRRAISAYSSEARVPGPEERCVWWATGPDPRVPYAVTAGTIEHYVGLIDLLRTGAPPGLLPGSPVERSELVYRASVGHHDVFVYRGRRFIDADVVRLELSVTLFGEGPAAFGVSLVRLVVFRPDEEPLPLGDGEAMVWGS
jgi:hypothetical protein